MQIRSIFLKIINQLLYRVQSVKTYRSVLKYLFSQKIRIIENGSIAEKSQLGQINTGSDSTRSASEGDITHQWNILVIKSYLMKKSLGFLTLQSNPELADLYPDWWIFSMHVTPLVRGAGIGEKLVLYALNKAKELGAVNVYLLVKQNNHRAIALYNKSGFSTCNLEKMQQRLEEEVRQGYDRRITMCKML